jgi:signal transduction histidine kinase/CheY-like chemotaxis protein
LVLDAALEDHAGLVSELKIGAPWTRVVMIGYSPHAELAGLPSYPKPFDAAELAERLLQERELSVALKSRQLLHRQVEHAERLASIGRVSAGMAHEINNPLAVIRASAAYVAMVAARSNDGELATCAEDIEVAVARIGSFVEHLSGFASQERPRIVYAPLRPALEIALRMLRVYANESDVTVKFRTGPVVCAPHDPPRLAQAALNLLFFAVRRAAQGGRHVEFGARAGDSEAYIEVEDDGPRPSAEVASQAFEVFSADASGGGSGLGLSITRRIAHDHGGCVWLEPLPSEGARAVLALPRFNPSVHSVLVVDDELEIRRSLTSELRRACFDVMAVETLMDARLALREREVHVLIADAQLPDLEGPLSAFLARESPATQGLLLSSDRETKPADDTPVLMRPWDHSELLRMVRVLCERGLPEAFL